MVSGTYWLKASNSVAPPSLAYCGMISQGEAFQVLLPVARVYNTLLQQKLGQVIGALVRDCLGTGMLKEVTVPSFRSRQHPFCWMKM